MAVFIMFSFTCCNNKDINTNIDETAETVCEQTPSPKNSSTGGEWALIGIMESGYDEAEKDTYASRYYDNVRVSVKSKKGRLSDTYTTEYARTIMGLCAIGKDPRNVEGYDLTQALDDREMTISQGVNGACYALVAADMADVKLKNEKQYISFIMESVGDMEASSGTDYISMAILALGRYKSGEIDTFVKKQTDKLSGAQQDDGSLENCEATAEAIIALSTAGIDVTEDERFIKNGNSLLDGLMLYYSKDGFYHSRDGKEETDIMATEKGLLAMESVEAFKNGHVLYRSRLQGSEGN